jgi:hypothetical protein
LTGRAILAPSPVAVPAFAVNVASARVAPRRHRARQWLPQRFVELLDRDTPAKPQELEKARSMMLDVVASLGITRAQRGSSCRPTR